MKSNEFITDGMSKKGNQKYWQAVLHGEGFVSDKDDPNDYIITRPELNKIIKLIHKNCQPFLTQAKGGALYRGLKEDEHFLKKKARLQGRKPLNTPGDIHKMLNQFFTLKHGEPFRDAMFATGNMNIADNYGNALYRVFPIGQFEFLWSPKVHDLYQEWENMDTDWYATPAEMKKLHKKFHDRHLAKNYKTTGMAQAISSKNEIMIRCKNYYAVNQEIFWDVPDHWLEGFK